MSFVFLVIVEIFGTWFLNVKMNIPSERMGAANFVFQISVISFIVGLMSSPYIASIIAHEKMSAFAYMSILDVILRLLIVYVLYLSSFDKLKTFAILGLFVGIIIQTMYVIYCKRKFEECSYRFIIDKSLLKNMTGFAGWVFFGNGAWILNTQGLNILINLFFGVTLNASRGIADQVNGFVTRFVDNFTIAMNPQITKSFAEGDFEYMHNLVCWGAKLSYYLMLIFVMPICLEAEQILHLWLGVVPEYTVTFVRLTLASTMCTVIGNSLVTSMQASGKVKRYQTWVSVWGFLCFPLTYIAFKVGWSPIWAYIIYLIIYFFLIFIRIYLVKELIHMKWQRYVYDVCFICFIVTIVALIIPFLIYYIQSSSMLRLIEVSVTSFVSSICTIYMLGLKKNERREIIKVIKKKIL